MIDLINGKNANINSDSDGQLSYILLKKCKLINGIGGFNGIRFSRNILSEKENVEEMWNDVFIDIFSPKENVITIDQHIISSDKKPIIFENKINPHLLIEHHYSHNASFCSKYPLSTFIFILSILEREKKVNFKIDLYREITNDFKFIDLILRADGALENSYKYKNNVKEWSNKIKEYSNNGKYTCEILNYLLNMDFETAKKLNEHISKFYTEHMLRNDGGYNEAYSIDFNIRNLNKFLRSYAKCFDLNLASKNKTFFVYEGKASESKIIKENNELNTFDTYAFIRKDVLSYTKDIIKKEECININIYE